MQGQIKYSKRAVRILEALDITYWQVKGGQLAFIIPKSDHEILCEIVAEDIETDEYFL